METIGIITCCGISLIVGLVIGGFFFAKQIKKQEEELADYEDLKFWKFENEQGLKRLPELQSFELLKNELNKFGIDYIQANDSLQQLLCSMGDLIHGITGYHYKVPNKELVKYWPLVSQMALVMRHYPIGKNPDIMYGRIDSYMSAFPEVETTDLVRFMKRYVDRYYTHTQFIELCGQLMYGETSIDEAIRFVLTIDDPVAHSDEEKKN